MIEYMAQKVAGRNHVGSSNLTVIRDGFNSLKRDTRRDPAQREARRAFYRALVEAHEANRAEFIYWRF